MVRQISIFFFSNNFSHSRACVLDDSASGWAVKVLQYRSVAFVTYKSELSGQFAKEAMACQSLDNDEILNVRWATEDPNPVQKVAEKRRLEDMGREAIQSRIDPRVIDAMRAVRALEEGDVLDEEGNFVEGDEEQSGGEHDPKRRRIEGATEAPPFTIHPEPPKQKTGLLSADTLEGLKYFAEIRKRNGAGVTSSGSLAPAAPPKPLAGLSLDYGSDED